MKKIIVFLYILLTIILAIATILEALYGTGFIQEYCYGSSCFFALWSVIGIWGLLYILQRKLWERPAALLLHTAFIVMLIGAGITWIWGEKGIVHIREGETQETFVQTSDTMVRKLPFQMQLQKFETSYYPGTQTAANYISHISITENGKEIQKATISMNNILSYKGYRFYQSSFDDDNKGTWLSVNHDPIGIGVTYAGYFLMLISMIFILLSKKCGFRKLLKNPLLQKGFISLLIAFSLTPNNLSAQETEKTKPIWPKEYADSAASIQVLYNDRIAPFNTLARDFTLKLYGKPSYKGLTAEQIVGSWLLFPDVWAKEPMILIKNDEIRQELGLTNKYARYIDFFDENGTYKLKTLWEKSHNIHTNEAPSALQKAISQVDEKVALITMLQQGELIQKLPPNIQALPEQKITAEIWYNKIPFCKILFMFNLTIGIVSLITFILQFIGNQKIKLIKNLSLASHILLLVAFLFHTVGIALCWYISGRIPISNGYETMMFVAWCILLVSFILRNKVRLFVPFGFLLSGFTLLVAYLGQSNPQITVLMPVLHSPILSIHVSILMFAYALYGFTTLNGIACLCLFRNKEKYEQHIQKITIVSKLILYPATFCMGIGIFIGAIWANISWGTYWSWDPKETWALITFLVYGAAFHTESVGKFNKPLFFHLYIVLAFATVLMTYFGVNELLGGMHSYK